MKTKIYLLAAVVITAIVVVVTSGRQKQTQSELRQLTRAQLELRGDLLYAIDTNLIFDGTLIEDYAPGVPKLRIQIRAGRPHGLSRGFYESGQQEVEEHFVNGVADGLRTRWYENGQKKSEANIVHGKIEGTFTRWYDNGQLAAEAQMRGGKPHGLSQAWHRSGAKKARVDLRDGSAISKEYWEDGDA